jgi:two-component system response regulator AtoC
MADPTQERTRSHAWEASEANAFRVLVFWEDGMCAHDLRSGETLILGRAEGTDLHVLHPSVSRRHAAIHGGPPVRIEDLGSANGLRVGGVHVVRRSQELSPGRVVEVGAAVLVLHAHALHAQERTPPTADVEHDQGPAMARVDKLVSLVAKSQLSVLIFGETGVGKERAAEALHTQSSRAKGPFMRLNCAALTESLLESELFGFEKGAFTGAQRAKPGLIETAHGGTLFLDEVGEMPPATQVTLLRVLENHEVRRIGALQSSPVDVRIIAATHRDLRALIRDGRFREDLFFRLNGVSISIPPLRERKGEIERLAHAFAERAAEGTQGAKPTFTTKGLAALEGHDWPGNVRELHNVVERAVVLSEGAPIDVKHLQLENTPPASSSTGLVEDLEHFERARVVEALRRARGNQTLAAEILGISRRTLINRIVQYDLPRPRKR